MGVIPGPSGPKDPNSFLFPTFLELLELSKGVPMEDPRKFARFDFHAYMILKSGDLPDIAKWVGNKGHSAFSGCSECEATGVRILAYGNCNSLKILLFPAQASR